jgi:hypothetical protein
VHQQRAFRALLLGLVVPPFYLLLKFPRNSCCGFALVREHVRTSLLVCFPEATAAPHFPAQSQPFSSPLSSCDLRFTPPPHFTSAIPVCSPPAWPLHLVARPLSAAPASPPFAPRRRRRRRRRPLPPATPGSCFPAAPPTDAAFCCFSMPYSSELTRSATSLSFSSGDYGPSSEPPRCEKMAIATSFSMWHMSGPSSSISSSTSFSVFPKPSAILLCSLLSSADCHSAS